MITTELLTAPDIVSIDLKNKLSKIYTQSGIPKKYHFCDLDTDWSVSFSPRGTLTGVAKKRSEIVYRVVSDYIKSLDSIKAGNGLKIKFKDSVRFVTDLLLDGTKFSGKTFLLSVIAQGAINRGYTTKYIEWSDYIDRFISFEGRNTNEEFFYQCLDVDFLIIDSIFQYDVSNNKFFMIQLDRLISSRLNSGKTTICSIDTTDNQNPIFGNIWNKFTRETFTLKLPEADIKNEVKSKRTRI